MFLQRTLGHRTTSPSDIPNVGVIRNKPPRLEDAIAFLGNEANHTTINVRMKELRQNLFKGSVLPGTAANRLLKDDSTALPRACT